MSKPVCSFCGVQLGKLALGGSNGKAYCSVACVNSDEHTIEPLKYNEPVHYHKYEIDTIEFLQKGFPPEVFRGFAIGSITKYLHRAQEKNGLDDYLKAMDYAKRLYEFEKDSGRS